MLRSHPALPRRQHGLTLVELMIGLTLGLIISSSLMLLLARSSTQSQDFNRANAQIENGRYVAELLQEDLRLAGYFGELNARSTNFSTPSPCSTAPATAFAYDAAASVPLTVPAAVQGYAAGDVLPCLANRRAGTQAIALRRVDTATRSVATLSSANGTYYVQYSFCSTDPNTKLVYGTAKDNFTLRTRGTAAAPCNGTAPVRAYVSRVYYIADCNVCGTDNIPTLKRVDLVGTQLVETALADGVENLRLEYGIDTDGDGAPNRYFEQLADAGATATWGDVMAVRVHFITRSVDKASGTGLSATQTFTLGELEPITVANDGYVRHAYSNVVRLVNPAGAREIP